METFWRLLAKGAVRSVGLLPDDERHVRAYVSSALARCCNHTSFDLT